MHHRHLLQAPGGLATFLLMLVLATLATFPVQAQDDDAPAPAPQPLTEAMQAEFDEMFAGIDEQRQDAADTNNRIPSAAEPLLSILHVRLARDRIELLEHGIEFAEIVRARGEAGYDIDPYEAQAIEVLQTHPDIFLAAWQHAETRTEFPSPDLGAAELAASYRRFFELQSSINRLITLMSQSFSLLDEYGVGPVDAETEFLDRLEERAINASIFLDIAQEEMGGIRAGLAALPGDTELTGKLAVVESRIAQTAISLEHVADELAERGINVSDYREQIVRATGAITAESVDISVVSSLLSGWSREFRDVMMAEGPTWVLRILLIAAILFVFIKLAQITRSLVESGLNRSHAALSQLLKRMIITSVANLVLLIGVLIALSQLGISLGPLLAGLGIAGFVLGFALQDSLSNFASGMMILFTRPYDVGDVVEVGGVLGNVEAMSLVNTTIHTFDNQRMILPNTMIWGGVIKNVTSQSIRRVDLKFGISYSDDIPKTEAILKEIVAGHELVLEDPEPIIKLHELGDSSVNFVVRPWTQTEDYWTVYWDLTRAVKMRFDAEGISIPFPQRDVHLITESKESE